MTRADHHGGVDMVLSLCKGDGMSGLCTRCKVDAALPDSDMCSDCLRDYALVSVLVARLERAKPPHGCQYGTPWCYGPESNVCCRDCAEFGPGVAA